MRAAAPRLPVLLASRSGPLPERDAQAMRWPPSSRLRTWQPMLPASGTEALCEQNALAEAEADHDAQAVV